MTYISTQFITISEPLFEQHQLRLANHHHHDTLRLLALVFSPD